MIIVWNDDEIIILLLLFEFEELFNSGLLSLLIGMLDKFIVFSL